jgi:hypothetical protein
LFANFNLFSGALPPGLTLSTAGLLSGTPTAAGDYDFVVRMRDANDCIGVRNYTLIVRPNCPAITINPATLPNGTAGVTVENGAGNLAPSAIVATGAIEVATNHTRLEFFSPVAQPREVLPFAA